jgi:hypothetical protein
LLDHPQGRPTWGRGALIGEPYHLFGAGGRPNLEAVEPSHRVVAVDGRAIDEAAELDAGAVWEEAGTGAFRPCAPRRGHLSAWRRHPPRLGSNC